MYALIKPDEDGNPISYLEDSELGDINQLMEDYGVKSWVENFTDPNYWNEGDAMLVKITCVNPKPKSMVESWEVPGRG